MATKPRTEEIDPGPVPDPDLPVMEAPTPPLEPEDYRDPREENEPGTPRMGNMPSNETFTQLGDYPQQVARETLEHDPLTGFLIRKDVPPDPNHGPHSGMTDEPDVLEPPTDHPERSEESDPEGAAERHKIHIGAEDAEDTPVAGTNLTGEQAEKIALKQMKEREAKK
jgi:hypothetical protein